MVRAPGLVRVRVLVRLRPPSLVRVRVCVRVRVTCPGQGLRLALGLLFGPVVYTAKARGSISASARD